MNSHTTPRPLPGRSIGTGATSHFQPLQQQQQLQQQQPQQQQGSQRPQQPLAPQVSSSEEYRAITDEDREHIDEVVSHEIPSPSLCLPLASSLIECRALTLSKIQFDLMDMKKKGWLNSYEFKHSLAALGFDLSKPEYFHLLESYGSVPPDWQIDQQSCPVNRFHMYLDQFRLCAAKMIANRDPREEAAKVFNMFDYDQDGLISVDDLKHLAQEIRDDRTLSDEEIQNMVDHLDHNGKGGVNLDEFLQMMEEAG